MTTAAIMQPTYLAWLGYFAMMAESDVFVFLDNVQFEKRSWQQRNRVKGPQGEKLLTVPVLSKGAADQAISEAVIEPGSNFRKQHIETLRHYYGRSPHFAEASALLFPLIDNATSHLADYTINMTTKIAQALGITPRMLRGSTLAAEGRKAALLAAICVELKASRYISAPGSYDYLASSDDFGNAGIDVTYNTFRVAPYAQLHGEFVSHLSVADALFCIGIEATAALIQAGRHLTPAAAYSAERSVA